MMPTDEPPTPQVVALSVDLMDRSKIGGAFPDARVVRSMGRLVDAVEELAADRRELLVVIDLRRVGDTSELAGVVERLGSRGRVVAFGSHVDDDMLGAAEAAGAEALPRSVFFRRIAAREL